MRRVLVLRPEPGASATVKRARERGLDAVPVPLFEIEPVEWDAPEAGSFDGLLITSANAIRSAGEQLLQVRGLPVYAVGAATAEAAREAGFDVASAGEAGAERLLGSIEQDLRLLHLCGEDRKSVPDAKQRIEPVVVYRSRAKEGVDLSGAEGSIALVHSARAGRRFAELVETSIGKDTISIAAISHEAAEAAGNGWAAVESAEAPSHDALLALTERLCNKAPAP
jgi:uroporphyrinogen-III synthase